jgi:hypothetical protein
MTKTQRRLAFAGLVLGAALASGYAYYLSLVPATHPDHDHGILNLDAGGRLLVATRSGKTRNLVGRPGHILVIHFFSTKAPGAAEELAALFGLQRKAEPDTEFVLIAQDPDFATVDAWLAAQKLEPPSKDEIVLDPDGDTTRKLNSKRPLETMFFNADGKLSSQARGAADWGIDTQAQIEKARGGATIE